MWKIHLGVAALVAAASPALLLGAGNEFLQTNLSSDLPGIANNQDTDLVNPWGITSSPAGSPFWTSDNGTGLSTLYNTAGGKLGLVVTIPPAPGQSAPSNPTGVVFNGTPGFGGSHFIFDTEAGTIASWSSGTSAAISQTGAAGSAYKGLGLLGTQLYAANFGLGRIDVFDSSFNPVSVSGGFKDPNLPSGYAPFNVQNLNGTLYVTFAKTTGGDDEMDGSGLGFVDAFDANGNLLKRVASQGQLNAPWGLAVAPDGFGPFGNDLLVGNFGDGTINVYDPNTGTFVATLDDQSGNPIVLPGLWGLIFGNGGSGGNPNDLYFNAGIGGNGDPVESHGLFGSLTAVPEPGTVPVTFAGVAALSVAIGLRRYRINASRKA